MDILSTALDWYRNGTTTIPCRPHSKIPTVKWSRWMYTLPPRGLVKHWFSTGEPNIALITGGRGSIVVLDFDDLDRYDDWIRDTQIETYTVATPRPGRHVYLRTKPTSSMQLDGVEVKGTRSCVMSPPSIHPSGNQYEVISHTNIAWVGSLSENGLEETPRAYNSVKEKIDPSTLIGRIRQETPLLLLLSQFTNPIPSTADGRWFVMRCPHPQHQDRNPSFWCDAYRGICGCFTSFCRDTHPNCRPMDVINLYAWLNGVTNQEAIQALS